MKKLFPVVALFVLFTACKDKKAEPKTGDTPATNTTSTTTPTSEATTTAATPGVPKFSDPEVQKFANDYGAFMNEYKEGMKDPAKLADLSKKLQEWSTKAQGMAMKMAQNPAEAKAWADWTMELSKSMIPGAK
jgi:hypothetical protein